MRRDDKACCDMDVIEQIIADAQVCHLALCDNNTPYVVPLCFGYRYKTVYIHCANEGRKLDILRNNSTVFVEFTTNAEVVEGPVACNWKMRYKCVMGEGSAEFLIDPVEKHNALSVIMDHYARNRSFAFSEQELAKTTIVKVSLSHLSCKLSGYAPSKPF
jgi:uncharacterized protein